MRRCLIALALAAVPAVASAHPGGAEAHSGFLIGLLHPFTELDHLAAVLAIGVAIGLGLPMLRNDAWFPRTVGALVALTGAGMALSLVAG